MNDRLLKHALPIVAALCLCHCNAPKNQEEIERYLSLHAEFNRLYPE